MWLPVIVESVTVRVVGAMLRHGLVCLHHNVAG